MATIRFPVVRLLKFTGTISLGLLTGLSYTLGALAYPSLLHLPTAPSASQAQSLLSQKTKQYQRTLSTLASACLITAFALSPRRTAHPYLLWTSAVALIGANARVEWFFARRFDRRQAAQQKEGAVASPVVSPVRDQQDVMGESAVLVGAASSSGAESDSEGVAAEQARINGEVVRRSLERGMAVEWGRTVVSGFAFAMAVVGLWGDGA